MLRHSHEIETSSQLRQVRYEIRGNLARRAHELERQGYEIIPLNIGNPGLFGLRTPETMRLAMIENLAASEPYCNQKGIFPAREAVVMQQQARGVTNVTAEHVFMGNGVSELIDLTLRALLNAGDEVLIPSPDYPLWTAATVLNGGKAVYYPCPEDQQFNPDVAAIEALITPRTRALVVINPNNPTGAVYDRERLAALARLAERHHLVMLSDEIYDQMVYDDAEFVPMATLCHETLLRDLQRPVENLSGVRLSRRVGVLQRRRGSGRALPDGARFACGAASVQQRAGPMGRSDRARRLSERSQPLRAGRPALSIAPRP